MQPGSPSFISTARELAAFLQRQTCRSTWDTNASWARDLLGLAREGHEGDLSQQHNPPPLLDPHLLGCPIHCLPDILREEPAESILIRASLVKPFSKILEGRKVQELIRSVRQAPFLMACPEP